MNIFFMVSSIKRDVLLASIVGVLLGVCGSAHANEADDQIGRLVAQAQTQAAAHAPGDVARTIDEVVKLVPHASMEGIAAMTKLMEDLDRMMPDAGREPAAADTAPKLAAAPSPPAAQAPPTLAPAQAGLLDLLRRKGDAAFQASDISTARRYYQRGAEALARTYDAQELRRIGAIGVAPDPALAETWRNQAQQLGRSTAQ